MQTKTIIDLHTKKEKESKHNAIDSKSKEKGTKNGRGKKKTYKKKSKTINKMAIGTYILIITLSVMD